MFELALRLCLVVSLAPMVLGVCPEGQYGDNCTLPCSSNCKNKLCHPGDGTCDACVERFWGPNCNESCSVNCRDGCDQLTGDCDRCKAGFWTNDCTVPCQGHCDEHGCDQRLGTCHRNCIRGFYGELCNQTCPFGCPSCRKESGSCTSCSYGYHGTFCNMTCPLNCKDTCNKATGNCFECLTGYWGLNCTEQCDHRCICDQFTGNCTSCNKGYCGSKCEKPCKTPNNCYHGYCDKETCECRSCHYNEYMGSLCLDRCPGLCHKCYRNGTCYSCNKGSRKHGPACEKDCLNCNVDCNTNTGYCTQCINGTYGDNCELSCDCQSCDRRTGYCYRCHDGYFGDTCNRTCPENCNHKVCDRQFGVCDSCVGFYGQQCESRCPENCIDECDRSTGYCGGCPNGFWGNYCNNTCPSNCYESTCDQLTGECFKCKGYYGDRCENPCGAKCLDCDKVTGICNSCHAGFWGVNCNQTCPDQCEAKACDIHSGMCESCLTNFWGPFCENACHSNNCVDAFGESKCNREDGFCLSCRKGYWGKDCKLNCSHSCHSGCQMGTKYCLSCSGHAYGRDCEIPCSVHCKLRNNDPGDDICDREGICVHGCQLGWYGLMCNDKCVKCKGSTCHHKTGVCDFGCLDGYEQNQNKVCVAVIESYTTFTPSSSIIAGTFTIAAATGTKGEQSSTLPDASTTRTVTDSGQNARRIDEHTHPLNTITFVICIGILVALCGLAIAVGIHLYRKRAHVRKSSTSEQSSPAVNMVSGNVNLGLELDEPQILMSDGDRPSRNSEFSYESGSSGFVALGMAPPEPSSGYDYLRPTARYMDLNNATSNG